MRTSAARFKLAKHQYFGKFKNLLSSTEEISKLHHSSYLRNKLITRSTLCRFSKEFFLSRQDDLKVRNNANLNNDIMTIFMTQPSISPFKKVEKPEPNNVVSRVYVDKIKICDSDKKLFNSIMNKVYTKFTSKSQNLDSLELFMTTLGGNIQGYGDDDDTKEPTVQEIRRFIIQKVVEPCCRLAKLTFDSDLVIKEKHRVTIKSKGVKHSCKPDVQIINNKTGKPHLIFRAQKNLPNYETEQFKNSQSFKELFHEQVITQARYAVLTDGHIYYISYMNWNSVHNDFRFSLDKFNAINTPGEPSIFGYILTKLFCDEFPKEVEDLSFKQLILPKEKLQEGHSKGINSYIKEQKNNIFYKTIDFGKDWDKVQISDELSETPKFIIPTDVLLKHTACHIDEVIIKKLVQYESIVLQILDIEALFQYRVDPYDEYVHECVEEELFLMFDDIIDGENRASELKIQPNTNRFALFGKKTLEQNCLIKKNGLSLCLGPVIGHGSMLKVGETIGKERLKEAEDILSRLKKEELIAVDKGMTSEEYIMERALIGLNNELYFIDLHNDFEYLVA